MFSSVLAEMLAAQEKTVTYVKAYVMLITLAKCIMLIVGAFVLSDESTNQPWFCVLNCVLDGNSGIAASALAFCLAMLALTIGWYKLLPSRLMQGAIVSSSTQPPASNRHILPASPSSVHSVNVWKVATYAYDRCQSPFAHSCVAELAAIRRSSL